jgi:putative acetyltransferase
MGEVTIRTIRMADAEDLLALVTMPGVRWGTTLTGAMTMMAEQHYLEEFAASSDRYMLGAEADGHIVGTIHLGALFGPRSRHVAHLGMMVHDQYVGRGIGTQLLVAMLDLADNWLGFHRVELDVMVDNAPAIRLYEKCGFVREGIKHDVVLREGRYVDCYFMARIRPVVSSQ